MCCHTGGSGVKSTLEGGMAKEGTQVVGNRLYLPGCVGGSLVNFLVDTGSGVSILAARVWRKWRRPENELQKYLGRLCSVEGRALECIGRARLAVTLGTRTVLWDFIVTKIGEDMGILGNDFAMAHRLTVLPHERAVYLPAVPRSGKDDMGECLPSARMRR